MLNVKLCWILIRCCIQKRCCCTVWIYKNPTLSLITISHLCTSRSRNIMIKQLIFSVYLREQSLTPESAYCTKFAIKQRLRLTFMSGIYSPVRFRKFGFIQDEHCRHFVTKYTFEILEIKFVLKTSAVFFLIKTESK